MRRHIAHPCEGSYPQAPVLTNFHRCHSRQSIDIEQALRQDRAILDQANQISAASDKSERGVFGMGCDCLRRISRPGEAKGVHGQAPRTAEAIASTMLG